MGCGAGVWSRPKGRSRVVDHLRTRGWPFRSPWVAQRGSTGGNRRWASPARGWLSGSGRPTRAARRRIHGSRTDTTHTAL